MEEEVRGYLHKKKDNNYGGKAQEENKKQMKKRNIDYLLNNKDKIEIGIRLLLWTPSTLQILNKMSTKHHYFTI
eukprot:14564194-Ditylum_brightwellii.AAC.1